MSTRRGLWAGLVWGSALAVSCAAPALASPSPSPRSEAHSARGAPPPPREPPPILRFRLRVDGRDAASSRTRVFVGAEVEWLVGRGASRRPAWTASPGTLADTASFDPGDFASYPEPLDTSMHLPSLVAALLLAAPESLPPAPPPAGLENVDPAPPASAAGCVQPPGPVLPVQVVSEVPDIGLVHAWTLEYAGIEDGGTRALLAAARARGALPRIRLQAGYDDDDQVNRDEFEVVENHREVSQYSLDLMLEWDLAELASGVDTYRAIREGRAQLELRHALINQATTAYFDRMRLAIDEVVRCSDPPDITRERRLRLWELDATLDGLTGGRWRTAFEDVPLSDSESNPPLGGSTSAPPESESP